MFHTASYDNKRTWPIYKYPELIAYLNGKRKDFFYFVNDFQNLYTGWSSLKNVANISQYQIREKAALTQNMDFFLGPDSGPMHIAGALDTPGLIMFGSIPPDSRINHYKSLSSITASNLACLGCGYKSCPVGVKCMTSLSTEKVGNKILELLK
jgi:ADP-heptose:LPS heptosyltransferase